MNTYRRAALTAACTAVVLGAAAGPAAATVHEITASYCSGGGHGNFDGNAVEPPGVSRFGSKNFAMPVIASGAVDGATFTTTDAPQVKVRAGIFAPTLELNAETVDHPSEHCKAMRP